ncbi:MAG: hypothetical protein JKY14_00575 [Paraglaciecola sp.]|nr:hypothetical protein [Paraglaciecola sp.]
MQTVTSRSFNQDPTAAKRAASISPVQITERGKVSHILLSISHYQEITDTSKNIIDMLAMPESDDYEFQKLDAKSIKPMEFD